jgi:hypothetical protein
MSKDTKTEIKKAPPKEPSLVLATREGDFEFDTQAGYDAAQKILGKDRTAAWAHRTGANQVRFLSWPDGQEYFVPDV